MPKYSRKAEFPGKSAQELYQVLARDLERFLKKTPLGQFEIHHTPEKCEVFAESSLFSATISCQDGLIKLDGQLGLLAMAFKPKIDDAIDRWLKKGLFGNAS